MLLFEVIIVGKVSDFIKFNYFVMVDFIMMERMIEYYVFYNIIIDLNFIEEWMWDWLYYWLCSLDLE